MDDYGNAVHRNRWSIAGAAGLVAFLLFWLSIGWSFLGGLIAGLVVFGILLVVIGLIGADAPAGGTAEGTRTEGDRTVPPSVSAGAGGAGGAAAAAASPVAANRSEGGMASAPNDRVEDRTTDDNPADRDEIVATAAEIAPARAADPAAAEPGAATRVGGTVNAPATTGAADPVPGGQTSDAPNSDAPISDAPIADGPVPDAPLPGETLRGPSAVPLADKTDEDADAAADASKPGEVVAAGNAGSKPPTLSAPRNGQPDDLLRIRGVGPKLAALCNSLGFWHFDQIAGWSEAEIDWVDAHLEGFKGRVRRDDWVAQARTLASGETSEFSDRGDRGGIQ